MALGLSPVPPRHQPTLVIPQDRPVYRITDEKGFFGPDDTLYAEGSILGYDDEPNPAMEPLNALAEQKMTKYLEKLDAEGRKVANKNGKSYTSLADAFEQSREMAKQESKKVQVIGGREMAPLMGAKKKPGKVAKIELEEQAAPLMGASRGKLALNNTHASVNDPTGAA